MDRSYSVPLIQEVDSCRKRRDHSTTLTRWFSRHEHATPASANPLNITWIGRIIIRHQITAALPPRKRPILNRVLQGPPSRAKQPACRRPVRVVERRPTLTGWHFQRTIQGAPVGRGHPQGTTRCLDVIVAVMAVAVISRRRIAVVAGPRSMGHFRGVTGARCWATRRRET